MADITGPLFTGKPEDHDPQDFMNWLECIILMKTGLTEPEKVRFLQLSLKTKSPADTWFSSLASTSEVSFAAVRTAFEIQWPPKPMAEKTTAEKQALLDATVLKLSDLGKRVAASTGAEEEFLHVVWADRVERLAADIPDTNNLLVASTHAVRDVTLEELMEKIEDERDLARYAPASPNTPLKALGAAFQNINLAPQQRRTPFVTQYQPQRTQPAVRTPFSTFVERPAHERLADMLHKALPIQPNNPDGLVSYNIQVTVWHNTHGQSGKGPSETRPYPLTPGSAPVASGECWTCGHRSHHPAPCSLPAVPALETKWRSIAQTIRKRVEAAVAAATNVNMVATESDEVQTYDVDDLAHLQELVNQGKVDGPSMMKGVKVPEHNKPLFGDEKRHVSKLYTPTRGEGALPASVAVIPDTCTTYHSKKNGNIFDLYGVDSPKEEKTEKTSIPFVHGVKLAGPKGEVVRFRSVFDDGALVNAIDEIMYLQSKDPSHGRWPVGSIERSVDGLGNSEDSLTQSNNAWAILFGKPLLEAFSAVHDYSDDTIRLPQGGNWVILDNQFANAQGIAANLLANLTVDIKQIIDTTGDREEE
ncbi:hypothetical protein BYT27DRAFT_7210764 [Phlegmacium glaucopus]|nr:hypothetical protein BYT27DRAFT_7210764 [Phlegmacium glaucopus]